MSNATFLLKEWNKAQGMKKEIADFFKLSQTKGFIQVLVTEECVHTRNHPYVKSRASRGVYAGTWIHPILFIKFVIWLNPKF